MLFFGIRPESKQDFRMKSLAPRSLELKAQNTFVQVSLRQRFVAGFGLDGAMRGKRFFNSCEGGKACSAQGHLGLMAQNGSLFAGDFFGAQKELQRLAAYRNMRVVHQIFPSPDLLTYDP